MKGQDDHSKGQVLGLAWYSPEEWLALRRVSADKGNLHTSHTEWQADAEAQLAGLREQGFQVVRVPIQVAELVAWCKENNRRIDGKARSEFTSLKVRGRGMTPDGTDVHLKATRVPRRDQPLPLLEKLEELYRRERKDAPPAPYPYDEEQGILRLPAEVVAEVRRMVHSGDVPGAMQRVEHLTGCGLRVAKDYVDGLRLAR